MADFAVGTRGTLRITDDGTTVRFYVLCSDPATYVGSYRWFGTVNGVSVGGTTTLGSGFGSRLLGAWTVTSSQYVSIGQQATGTSGLGGYYSSPGVYIGRATVPAAPSNKSVGKITATSFQHVFQGNSNGGSAITKWEVQLATNSSFSPVARTGNNSPNDGTIDHTNLQNHTQYWSRVRGWNSVGAGPWAPAVTATTLGHPTAPRSPVATPSPSVTGRVSLSWTVPATTGAGGIVGYNIYRDGVQISTTTGTGTTYTDDGLVPYQSYAYTIAARNAYSTSVSGVGPQSTAVTVIAPGPPSPPTGLTGASDNTIPGKVNLSWTAPVNTGAGGITGYTVRLADGTFIANTTGTGTTYSPTGLTPGVTYTFVVTARNALADTEGSESAYSNQVVITPIGEPQAPTGVTVTPSTTTSNRLLVSWTPPAGVLSGYSIFSRVNGADTLLAKVSTNHTTYAVDNLTAGQTTSYVVRARTVYTDTLANGYPGNWGGPASAAASGTATVNNAQAPVVGLNAVSNNTNAVFNGTYTINGVTATTIRYAKTNANIPVALSSGTVLNATNAIFNGSYVIDTPTARTFTYAKTNANISALDAAGTMTNDTNVSLNGSVTVTAVNTGANTLSYSKTGANVTARAVPVNTPPGGVNKITNLSSTIFNGTGFVITDISSATTFSYAKTNANVAESNASGTAYNTTNRDIFNGTYTITNLPAYNVVKYAKTASNVTPARTWFEPNGTLERAASPSTLDIKFRSGWAG
ncbi:minor tail protein [Microbacterium phage Pumpernickel]|uniref:Minor tail protein n=1 Tax=Microbacterium phage Pumpernickel TaxID=2885983 RepID=A0AAE9C2U5_9CAUD|nr:minor tail protein [Microbacterium phage Pumpernickel]UDL15887.1 minor tail protein [Microbacterium phage Pumpernickel]